MGDYETSLWIVLGVWTFFMVCIAVMLLSIEGGGPVRECIRGVAAVLVMLILFTGILAIVEAKAFRLR